MDDLSNNNKDIEHLNQVFDAVTEEMDAFDKDMTRDEAEIASLIAELDEERQILRPILAELTRQEEADFKALLEALAEAQ